MSIFDNIVFNEFTLLEGEQAEAYKKRKAEEKSAKDKAENERNIRRYDAGKDGFYRPAGAKKSYDSGFFKSEDEEKHRYKGKGDRSKYNYVDTEDDDRQKKADSILRKESDKRYEDYENATSRAIEHDKSHPGERPKGIFKGRDKKEYDKKLKDHNTKSKELEKDMDDKYNAYRRANTKGTEDAINRHIRRHPKQYKESTFENIEMI